MTRGFFSGFVAVMGVLLLIALMYAHSARDGSIAKTDELLIGHSLLNRDWALARNAYSQFASDAMADQIRDSSSCNVPLASNFLAKVTEYWLSVHNRLLTYGVNCVASVDLPLQNDMGNPSPSVEVKDDAPAYALLTCTRTIGGVPNTLTHPFVIWKDIDASVINPTTCQVTVTNKLGLGAYSTPVLAPIEVFDTFTFP